MSADPAGHDVMTGPTFSTVCDLVVRTRPSESRWSVRSQFCRYRLRFAADPAGAAEDW